MTSSGAGAAPGVPLPALSTFDAAMIVCGIVIGGGIFALPPLVASMSGSVSWMFIAWALGAVLTLVGSLCYAELASTFPHAGGDYHFLTRAFGRDVSFFFGWARIVVTTTGPTAVHAYIFGDYASRILPLGSGSSTIYAALVVALYAVPTTSPVSFMPPLPTLVYGEEPPPGGSGTGVALEAVAINA